ncbi:MAG: hypothetical protein SFV21_13950 [Rhodospirillaceae bacterium]|nr:hypothetical protein [Rhodospirillaceae bacterium]
MTDRPAAPSPPTSAAPAADEPPILIWEDESPGAQHWWLARAHHGPRQFYIAYDDLTAHLVAVERLATSVGFATIAVVPVDPARIVDALAAVKQTAAAVLAGQTRAARAAVRRWRVRRGLALIARQSLLGATAGAVGAMLALAVAMFAVTTDLVGWPMLAAGIAIGGGAGLLLRGLAVRRLAPDLGPWGRLVLAIGAAACGAALAAGGFLALFWPPGS